MPGPGSLMSSRRNNDRRLVFAFLLALACAQAQPRAAGAAPRVDIIDTRDEFFENDPGACRATGTCALIRARLRVQNYAVWVEGEPNYGTRMFAQYETASRSDLERFVFVQWIRGCHYDSLREPDGTVSRFHSYARDYFGQVVPFRHPDWMIDSYDTDPAFASQVEQALPRHHAYRWNSVGGSFEQKTEHFYGDDPSPPSPALYVADRPGVAFVGKIPGVGISAKNISTQYRICLYRIEDVPLAADPHQAQLGGPPIRCFEWASSWIFNFEQGSYERPSEVDPFCLEPLASRAR